MSHESALLLADGLYTSVFAKTSHGLVRGPSRWPIAAVVDADHAGTDAGALLDGVARDIPILASVDEALERLTPRPTHAIVGVATVGGVLPDAVRDGLLAAARAGLTLVNGLHRLLSEDEPELAALAAEHGATILDIRRPRPARELRFWTGEILSLDVPRAAVLGTDCAQGKRTTAGRLRAGLDTVGHRAEMVFTGQTGWLQGYPFGFLFDATPNDFVCGELEGAILDCARATSPDIILLEGQSGLRNPSGPCGAEFLLAGAAAGVVLQHTPGRTAYEGLESVGPDGRGCPLPEIASEIALIRAYGVDVWAVGLHTEGLDGAAVEPLRARLEDEIGLPVVLPLRAGDLDRLVATVAERAGLGSTP
ncbi:MAG: DUF1611 domain-containing protein [Acidobacteriota bacterium]